MAGVAHLVKRGGWTGWCMLLGMPPFVVERHPDLADFLAAAHDWLAAREAEHNLPLGVLAGLAEDPAMFGTGAPVLLTVRDATARRLIAASVRTPPWRLILSEVDDAAALPVLADRIASDDAAVPGLVGPAEHAGRLAALLAERLDLRAVPGLAERAFRLRQVIPPRPVPGRARLAGPADRPLVAGWLDAFEREAIGEARPTHEADAIAHAEGLAIRLDRSLTQLGSRRIWLWEDGEPVSMAGINGPTPTGIRIGPVYTPPGRRRHGFASAVVAAASQAALDDGRRVVFLFTDLANPTSNHIYQAIGYEPVRDIDEWSLVPVGSYPEQATTGSRG